MRSFVCDRCGARIAFDNFQCLSCGAALAFSLVARRMVAAEEDGLDGRSPWQIQVTPQGPVEVSCANQQVAACNWLTDRPQEYGGLCLSCRVTRTRPADDDEDAREPFLRTEAAKRRLIYQLLDLGLPVEPKLADPEHGLAVDLLSSRTEAVTTGHADGVITVDLAEGEDPHREAVRVQLGEAYRTLLGHLRHESGHYYWDLLAGTEQRVERFRALFGDERVSYQQEIDRHYAQGPPAGWEQSYVSAYATMHPWEDWAETFAHYLHLRDVLQTANAWGLAVQRRVGDGELEGDLDALDDLDVVGADVTVAGLVERWLPLSFALNAVQRSMGKEELYPFVLTAEVIEKLDFVHACVLAVGPGGGEMADQEAIDEMAEEIVLEQDQTLA